VAGIPRHTTWPCDEIPGIWKHGNLDVPHHELGREHATEDVRAFVREAFRSRAENDEADVVVEKTCANALRVPFVDEVLPDAKFVHIVRDGRDAAVSATERWTGDTDLAYTLRKARFVPLSDVPRYAIDWLGNRLHRLLSEENRVSIWGPRFEGIEDVASNRSLLETCAHQWAHCVRQATADLDAIEASEERVHTVHYEDFVQNPTHAIDELAGFLDVDLPNEAIHDLAEPIHAGSVGKGREQLGDAELERIEPILGEVLETHGYH
jgi:hypothetical protein